MEGVVTKFEQTGECEISVSKVIEIWDENWVISQWKENEFTLCHFNKKASNFTKTDLKCRILESQAKELINTLDLKGSVNTTFGHGKTWRK